MKKVGIIDNYISNFHSNTYYDLFHKIAEEEGREEYVISHVYAKLDKSPSTNETTDEWCARTGAKKCDTPREVCDAVDVIMVLSPNNPELHRELVEDAFRSGKLVYVDKTFAPDYKTAREIDAFSKSVGARYWSSSAVRFDPVLLPYLKGEGGRVESAVAAGSNVFAIYSIHLIEMLNTVMGNGAASVTCLSGGKNLIFKIDYRDGRCAFYHQMIQASGVPFYISLDTENERCLRLECSSEFWRGFARGLLDYFDTGVSYVDTESTIECIAVRSAMKCAMENIGTAVAVEGAV
ncbi:MAG: Gfo/Idh/MocA family oxidoreductase [Clostridia bacterium]|nr:Gfo/Idh/MocA family oxidoreductase [Clostridia bacterium]